MKNFKEIKWMLLAAIVASLGASISHDITHDCTKKEKPKQGNIVVLGEGGSMRLAKPEDVDTKDVSFGLGIGYDKDEGRIYYDSVEKSLVLIVRDSLIVEYIKPESLYYNGIKLEIGQVWTVLNDNPFIEPIDITILDIKGQYIQYEEDGVKGSIYISMFNYWNLELKECDGYYTTRGTVRGNTSDLYKD